MTADRQTVIEQLRAILSGGKTLILGVGNTLREDDGVGPYVASLVQEKDDLTALDCGEAPEKYIGKALKEKPDTLLLVDAADFGGEPGQIRLLNLEEIQTRSVSTHDVSLKLLFDRIAREAQTSIVLLAFQPRSMRFGCGLSDDLRRSARDLAATLGLTANPNGKPDGRPENSADS